MDADDAGRPSAARTRPVVDDSVDERGVPVIREQTPVAEHVVAADEPTAVVAQPAPVVQERVVVQQIPVVQPHRPMARARTVVTRRFDPASALAVIAAIALGVVGAVAVARAGLDGPLDDPIVEVAGFSHTAILGLIEVGMAVVLLAVGLSRDRGALLFTSILFGAAALVAAIEPSVGGDALAIESSWAVVLVIVFAAIALAAAVMPAIWRTTETVEQV